MDIQQFITTYTGEAVCVDGTESNPPATNNSGQCEQLVALYSQKVNGVNLPIVSGAVNLWNNPAVQTNYIQVLPTQIQPNDIVVFNASVLINSPTYGHADICVGNVTSIGYQGFDSNWQPLNLNAAGYPTAHLVNHSYVDVLGGLRYKGGVMNTDGTVNDAICNLIFVAVLHRHATQADLDAWRGHDTVDFINQLYHSQEWANQDQLVKNGSGVTKSNVLTYINSNLS